jgi:hypothetical protein
LLDADIPPAEQGPYRHETLYLGSVGRFGFASVPGFEGWRSREFAALWTRASAASLQEFVALYAIVLSSCLALSQAKSDAVPAAPPTGKVVTMPVSEIKPGMHGVAYTVFEGTQPEPMKVVVLGVLKNANGPKGDMILVRLQGEKPEYTGVVAGMSGSPVYIDGKLIGALAFRIGQMSKEPIAGVTPIADMLEINEMDNSVAPAEAKKPGSPRNVL